MTQLPIDTPLPLAEPGGEAPFFDPQIHDLICRKLNALWNMQGVGNVKINRTEGNITIEVVS